MQTNKMLFSGGFGFKKGEILYLIWILYRLLFGYSRSNRAQQWAYVL